MRASKLAPDGRCLAVLPWAVCQQHISIEIEIEIVLDTVAFFPCDLLYATLVSNRRCVLRRPPSILGYMNLIRAHWALRRNKSIMINHIQDGQTDARGVTLISWHGHLFIPHHHLPHPPSSSSYSHPPAPQHWPSTSPPLPPSSYSPWPCSPSAQTPPSHPRLCPRQRTS